MKYSPAIRGVKPRASFEFTLKLSLCVNNSTISVSSFAQAIIKEPSMILLSNFKKLTLN